MRRLAGLVLTVLLVAACASRPPPKAEPVALEIPPLPQQTEPPPITTTRSAPPAPAAPAAPEDVDEPDSAGSTAPPLSRATPPGPMALPCTSDTHCMTHRCNVRYGKCAFPCHGDVDCVPGTQCFVAAGAMATCIPKPPP